jgi:hypothetical protein
MTDVLSAIIRHLKTRARDGGAWKLVDGRVYGHQAPVGTARPYIVLTPFAGEVLRVFGGRDIELPTVQCDVVADYDHNAAPAWEIVRALAADLEDGALTLMNAEHIQTRRADKTPRVDVADNVLTISQDWIVQYQVQPHIR